MLFLYLRLQIKTIETSWLTNDLWINCCNIDEMLDHADNTKSASLHVFRGRTLKKNI